jgi:hypothetical protein
MVALEASLAELIRRIPEFEPSVWFDREMDQLVCLREDCSYRADRVDPFLTLLWHPNREEIIGIKLKGIRSIFEEIVEAEGYSSQDFVPLVNVIGGVMLGIVVSNAMNKAERDDKHAEWREKYAEAREVADGMNVPTDLDKIALAA